MRPFKNIKKEQLYLTTYALDRTALSLTTQLIKLLEKMKRFEQKASYNAKERSMAQIYLNAALIELDKMVLNRKKEMIRH